MGWWSSAKPGAHAAQGAVSLADMPAEILDLVQRRIDRLSDAVSYCMALGDDGAYVITQRALARPKAFLEAGAPLSVARALVQTAFDRRGSPPPSATTSMTWLKAAIRGDRPDVVALLHSLAPIDHAADVTNTTWANVGRARWRRLYDQARKLLTVAASAGSLCSLSWLLDFYASPRFAARWPLLNQNMITCLCMSALDAGGPAVEMVAALHERAHSWPCSCPPELGLLCVRADRPDVIEWMETNGCSAPTRIMGNDHGVSLVQMAASRRAARSLTWLAQRTNKRHVVDAILKSVPQPTTHEGRLQTADLICRMNAEWTLVAIAAAIFLSLVGNAAQRRITSIKSFVVGQFEGVRGISTAQWPTSIAIVVIASVACALFAFL